MARFAEGRWQPAARGKGGTTKGVQNARHVARARDNKRHI